MDRFDFIGETYHDGTLTRDQYTSVRGGAEQSTAATSPESLQVPKQVVTEVDNCAGWENRAACKFPGALNVFFPPDYYERKHEKLEREQHAKAICQACPVIEPCLESALSAGQAQQHGIQGGLTDDERRRIIRMRQAPAT